MFNDILEDGMPFYNCALGKKGCSRVIDDTYAFAGRPATINLLDRMKEIGFKRSTTAGLSFGITDLRIPGKKQEIIDATQKKVDRVEKAYHGGAITERERYNQLLDLWTHCREEVQRELLKELKGDRRDEQGDPVPIDSAEGSKFLNPVWLMSDSGARGNVSQIQQLAGMRGLMSKPSGEIIETPIKANAREGMSVLEYFSSTHGARKGLADTALKTADSGYLTRKLADVGQNMGVVQHDCGTFGGVRKRATYKGEEVDVPLRESIIGRTARETVADPRVGGDESIIVRENEIITEEAALKIEDMGIDTVMVRSPLTCEAAEGTCALCYGQDMSTGRLVEKGLAIGIVAAQSIGEPGTQLTMRTFHTGGVATTSLVDTTHKAVNPGTVEIRDANVVATTDDDGQDVMVALKRNGEVAVLDEKGRELEKYKIPYGSFIKVNAGDKVKRGQVLVQWDPHRTAILAEKAGTVKFEDVVVGETVRPEAEGSAAKKKSGAGGGQQLVVIEHKGEMHPRITIVGDDGSILDFHYLPAKARIDVKEGTKVQPGHMLARQPRAATGSKDIVGGLPRVTEIFEARKPKDAAIVAEISGKVELKSDKRKGKMTITVTGEGGLEHDHHVPQDKALLVHTGDMIEAGDPLIEGPQDPKDILRVRGDEALYEYLLGEVQNVYRAQGVPINDKHIEVILSQMLRKVRVETTGDTDLLPNEVIDKFRFRDANNAASRQRIVKDPGDSNLPMNHAIDRKELKELNARLEADGKAPAQVTKAKPAKGKALLLGITKASLQSESFLSGASFQETTKVLTEAALAGKEDRLVGLKENVLLGHLIPVGTGFKPYQNMEVVKLAEPPQAASLSREEEIAAAAAMAEAAGAERASEITTTIKDSQIAAALLADEAAAK